MTEIVEKIAAIICNRIEYGFEFSDLTEGNFIRDKYINAARDIITYIGSAFSDESNTDAFKNKHSSAYQHSANNTADNKLDKPGNV
jgi:hypothetical protein